MNNCSPRFKTLSTPILLLINKIDQAKGPAVEEKVRFGRNC